MGSSAGSLVPLDARSFGDYELLARLATGGMAEIFLARRRAALMSDSVLVIKRVLPHLAEDARFVAMFRDEARLAARIEHPNVCRVLDQGSVDGTYFLALEYLHGMPLSRVLVRAARTGHPLDFRLVAGLMVQSCAGLHHAHELRNADGTLLEVVHRDVSPPNIFVAASGLVKLLDFGVAKAQGASEKTRTGTVKGKNAYMSPEQVLGHPMDRRSDLFSLGIVLWEALAARRLFMREVDFETFRAITQGDVPDLRKVRPDTPAELADVVRRALAIEPERRFASALELGDAVAAAVAGIGLPAGEREIAAFVKERFATELKAKDQLLDATGATAVASIDFRSGRGGPASGRPAGSALGRGRASTDPAADAVTTVRTAASESDASTGPGAIAWSPSRRSQPITRIRTGSMPRVDRAGSGTAVRSSPVPAVGSQPLGGVVSGWASRSGKGPGPRSVTMRVLPLPAPPGQATEPTYPIAGRSISPSGHAAAAVLFLAGLSGLLLLLWWLI